MTKGIKADIQELLALRYYASRINFFNNQKINTVTTGNKLSILRGKGMDFDEVRRYQPGDDIRLIHWPLSARLGKTYTKIYREERERSIYLLIDQSYSMCFGTRVCFKSVLAAKIAAICGFAALEQHEQIGGIVFNDDHSDFIPPKRSYQSLLDLFNLITRNKLEKNNGGLNNALQLVYKKLSSGSIVIIISDFFKLDENTSTYLNLIAKKAQLINLFVYDHLEKDLPDSGHYTFTDNGSNRLKINANRKSNELYAQPFLTRLNQIKTLAQKNNIPLIELATNDDLLKKLIIR